MGNGSVTLSDVAKLANVSAMTVSKVLNGRAGLSEQTRKRVLEAVRQTGYVGHASARSLASGRTDTLGLVVHELNSQYVGEIVRGAGDAAEEAGLDLLLHAAPGRTPQPPRRVKFASRGFVDGLLMVLPRSDEADLDLYARAGVPIVVIDHRASGVDLPSVGADNQGGAFAATEYLVGLGHRRIGFIAGRSNIGASADRLQGYTNALVKAGLSFDEALVRPGNFEQRGGYAAAAALLELEARPSAIFAANDVSAFGVMEAVKDRGLRVPDDVSVVGFDDIPMASHVHPALTTIHQPLYQMGHTAAVLVLALARGEKNIATRVQLPTALVVRESAGPR